MFPFDLWKALTSKHIHKNFERMNCLFVSRVFSPLHFGFPHVIFIYCAKCQQHEIPYCRKSTPSSETDTLVGATRPEEQLGYSLEQYGHHMSTSDVIARVCFFAQFRLVFAHFHPFLVDSSKIWVWVVRNKSACSFAQKCSFIQGQP